MWSPLDLISRALSLLDKHRGGTALLAAILAAGGLYALGDQAKIPPLRQGIEVSLGTLQTGVSGAMTFLNVWIWKENKDLRSALNKERLDRVRYEETMAENARLRLLLKFPSPPGFTALPC